MKSPARDGDSEPRTGSGRSTGGASSTGCAVMAQTLRRGCDSPAPQRRTGGRRAYGPAMCEVKGRVARQTHVGIPAGLVEEEHGREAFAGPVSHLYRTSPPTAWVDVDGPLRPLAFDLNRLSPADADDRRAGASPCCPTTTCASRSAGWPRRCRSPTQRRRRRGRLRAPGRGTCCRPTTARWRSAAQDYLVLPRGTAHRFVPDGPCFLLVVQSVAPVTPPGLRPDGPARRRRPAGAGPARAVRAAARRLARRPGRPLAAARAPARAVDDLPLPAQPVQRGRLGGRPLAVPAVDRPTSGR